MESPSTLFWIVRLNSPLVFGVSGAQFWEHRLVPLLALTGISAAQGNQTGMSPDSYAFHSVY